RLGRGKAGGMHSRFAPAGAEGAVVIAKLMLGRGGPRHGPWEQEPAPVRINSDALRDPRRKREQSRPKRVGKEPRFVETSGSQGQRIREEMSARENGVRARFRPVDRRGAGTGKDGQTIMR